MGRFLPSRAMLVVAALVILGSASEVQAQAPHQQVISANPFGLLLEWFNAEYERIISESATAGIGGSMYTDDDIDYGNVDVFFRFYPQSDPLDGWAFGAKLGLTDIDGSGTHFGYGFDVNRSWLLGRNRNFYVGVGFGLKRLVGVNEEEGENFLEYVPTFRLVNVGIAF